MANRPAPGTPGAAAPVAPSGVMQPLHRPVVAPIKEMLKFCRRKTVEARLRQAIIALAAHMT
jgi:hypothetical protein